MLRVNKFNSCVDTKANAFSNNELFLTLKSKQ